ncbi:MAG TPA: BatA domain-containing protein [Pirellulales bacterium]|jgi:hypothetical protein|nr:BatA domain-containing protein [Pirellulales bacterium]
MFSHIGMLWWLAAAAAPLVIHLLSRRRYREMSWAAMEYLLAALQKRSRRLRFEQWLLLAIRTALIVAVVIAVAGPYVERIGGTVAAGNSVHRVLVLDGSYSMAYKPGDRSRFEQAKDLIRDIVARSVQGDGFTLVLMSAPARTVVGTPAFVSDEVRDALRRLKNSSASDVAAAQRLVDEDDFLKELRDLKLPQGGGDLAGAIDRVDDIIARAKREFPRLSNTEVYFLSDLGRTKWEPGLAAGGPVRQRLVRLAASARLSVADLGQQHCENLAVTSLRATQAGQSIYTTKGPIDIAAEVHDFGSQSHSVRAELLVDSLRVQDRSLNLAAGNEQSVDFAYRFTSPGDHSLEVRLVGDPSDALDVDNHRWLVLPVKDSISALVVNGEGAAQHARYLVDALNPYRDGSESMPVQVEQVPDGGLLDLDLRRFDCIFLSNVAQFTAGEAHDLATYVGGGGGLVFFLGDRVDASLYNDQLGGLRPGWPRLLPALLDGRSEPGAYHFDPLDYADPLVHEFAGNERAGLLSTIVSRYFRLKKPGPSSHVAMAFRPTGDPAIVAARINGDNRQASEPASQVKGVAAESSPPPAAAPSSVAAKHPPSGGRSILVALPASFASVDPATKEPWSNWPLKASFQPLMQNLLLGAIGPQGADRTVSVGQPLESALPTGGASAAVVLQNPEGRKEQIRIAARDASNRWSYADTWQSGIYRAEVPAAASQGRLYAVNINPTESALVKIDPALLPEQLTVVPAVDGAQQQPTTQLGAQSNESRLFLYIALSLLLLETVVAWWFGYRAA